MVGRQGRRLDETPSIRLAELLGVLSLGVDLGMGQPMEHMLRACLVALNLAKRMGLEHDDQEAVYFASLVVWVGCHIDAYEQAKWFGDEAVLKGDFRLTDFHSALSGPVFMMRHLSRSRSLAQKVGVLPSFLGEGRQAAESMLENHWRASDDLMAQVGLDQLVRDTVEQTFERWDGRGIPKGLKGEEILIPSRLVNLADVVEVFYRLGGVDAAVGVARERAGTQFDPGLVDFFAGSAADVFAEIDAAPAWETVIATLPWLRATACPGRELNLALGAVADFSQDVTIALHDRSQPRSGRPSRRRRAGVRAHRARSHAGPARRTTARPGQPGHFEHDLGQAWRPQPGRAGAGTAPHLPDRAHAGLVNRSRPVGSHRRPASRTTRRLRIPEGPHRPRHHPPRVRLLAAADSYHARMEPRPHRPEIAPPHAASELQDEVRAGRLDADAVSAILGAAGHRANKRGSWPAGLTAREVDILRLLARGLSNKQIAARLTISTKTAGTHVEHIYTQARRDQPGIGQPVRRQTRTRHRWRRAPPDSRLSQPARCQPNRRTQRPLRFLNALRPSDA